MRRDRKHPGETPEHKNKAVATFARAVFSNMACFRKSHSELANIFRVSKSLEIQFLTT